MSSPDVATDAIQILSLRGDGQMFSFPVPAGKGVFIGSAANCGLQLSGPDIAPIHCRIAYDGKAIQVHDWMSLSGTYLDGEKVEGETEAFIGSSIHIGSQILKLAASADSDSRSENRVSSPCDTVAPSRGVASENASHSRSDLAPSDLDDTDPFGQDFAAEQNYRQTFTNDVSSRETEPRIPKSSIESSESLSQFAGDCKEITGQSIDSEEETETREIEEENLQPWCDDDWATDSLSSAWESDPSSDTSNPSYRSSWDPDEERATTNHLETRVRELVLEAELSDQRIGALEDLLLAAESAQAAQVEERQCLEAWLQDIEHKFSARESEHAAEIESLQGALSEKSEQLQKLQGKLSSNNQDSDPNSELLTLLEHLREANSQLEQQLQSSRQNCRQLEQQLSSSGEQESAEVRTQLAELAIERAELARQRHDLVNQLSQTSHIEKGVSAEDGEMACRLRALREHLREIHRQEQQDRSERSLTSRLSNLWNRVTR